MNQPTICAVDYGAGYDKAALYMPTDGQQTRPVVRRSLSRPARAFTMNFGKTENTSAIKAGLCSGPGARPQHLIEIGDSIYTGRDRTADYQVDASRYTGNRAKLHILTAIVQVHNRNNAIPTAQKQSIQTRETRIHTILGLGLNAEDYKFRAEEIRQEFTGTFHIVINETYYTITIEDVIVRPQPWAAYTHLLDTQPGVEDRRVMVLDWGRMTIDAIFVDDGDIAYDSFFALQMGVQRVVEQIRECVGQQFNTVIPPLEADRLLDPVVARNYPIGGTTRDLQELVDTCKQTHWDQTQELLRSRLQGTTVHVLAFVGGGAFVFKHQIEAWRRSGIPTTVPDQPHLAVLRGLLRETVEATLEAVVQYEEVC